MEWKLFANLADTVGRADVTLDHDDDATVEDPLEALFPPVSGG